MKNNGNSPISDGVYRGTPVPHCLRALLACEPVYDAAFADALAKISLNSDQPEDVCVPSHAYVALIAHNFASGTVAKAGATFAESTSDLLKNICSLSKLTADVQIMTLREKLEAGTPITAEDVDGIARIFSLHQNVLVAIRNNADRALEACDHGFYHYTWLVDDPDVDSDMQQRADTYMHQHEAEHIKAEADKTGASA